MSVRNLLPLLSMVSISMCFAQSLRAQEARGTGNLDLTMKLLPEGATSAEPITRQIELPATPPSSAGNDKDQGAKSSPIEGAGTGRDTAAEARERGREFGQDVAEQARENRENAGRGRGSTGPPATPPGRPDGVPGPPSTPPGQAQ